MVLNSLSNRLQNLSVILVQAPTVLSSRDEALQSSMGALRAGGGGRGAKATSMNTYIEFAEEWVPPGICRELKRFLAVPTSLGDYFEVVILRGSGDRVCTENGSFQMRILIFLTTFMEGNAEALIGS